MDIALSSSSLALAFIALVLVLVAVVVFLKSSYNRYQDKIDDLAEKHKDDDQTAQLKNRTKYPEANVFNWSGTFLLAGLAIALLLAVLAFSWSQFEETVYIPDDALELDEEIEIETPRTAEPPPPPPPPPPPVIEEVPEEEIEEEDEVEFQDQSIEEETVVAPPPKPEKKAPPPPPPPPPPPKEEEIFQVVEDMPRFPGCEDKGSKAEKQQCAQKKMLEYIYKEIEYPALARENGVEGTCVISFVVDSKGKVEKAEVLRDIGAGCGPEALRVVEKMAKEKTWIPGKQRGRAVSVQFNLPVKFRLQ